MKEDSKTKWIADKSIKDMIRDSFNKAIIYSMCVACIVSLGAFAVGYSRIAGKSQEVALQLVAERASASVLSYKNIAESLGLMQEFSDPAVSDDQKEALLYSYIEAFKLRGGRILNPDGTCNWDAFSRVHRTYFKEAMLGRVVIDDPIITQTYGDVSVIVAAPIWEKGEKGSSIAGVVTLFIPPTIINDLIANAKISENSYVYILSSNGTTVASKDIDEVYSRKNAILLAQSDKYYSDRAKIEKKIITGEGGNKLVWNHGHLFYYSYMPIEETPGWNICLVTPVTDFFGLPLALVFIIALITVGTILFARKRIAEISEIIMEPVDKVTDSIQKAAEGNFKFMEEEIGQPIEMSKITVAMESIFNRMELAGNEKEEYLDEAVLTDLISMDMLQYIHGHYMHSFKANVVFADSKGNIVAGKSEKEVADAKNPAVGEQAVFIMLYDRVIGSVIIDISEGCTLSTEEAIDHATYLSKILEIVATGNFSRGLNYRRDLRKTREEIERYGEYGESLILKSRAWVRMIDIALEGMDTQKYEEVIRSFMSDSFAIIEEVENLKEASILNSSSHIHEDTYEVWELADDIRRDVLKRQNGLAGKLDIRVSDKMPERLYGDSAIIRNVVSYIVAASSSGDMSDSVIIEISAKKAGYATNLCIKVKGNVSFDEKERRRIRTLVSGKAIGTKEIKTTSTTEIKLVSVSRMARRANGEIEVKRGEMGCTWFTLTLPQLEVTNDK